LSYVWTPLVVGITPISSAHYSEIINNVKDAEINKLLMTEAEKFIWSAGMDPFTKEFIDDAHILEIRSAVDGLDDNNICKAYYSTYHPGNDAILHSIYHNDMHNTYCATNHPGYDLDFRTARNSTDHGTDYSGYDGTDCGTKNSGYNSSY